MKTFPTIVAFLLKIEFFLRVAWILPYKGMAWEMSDQSDGLVVSKQLQQLTSWSYDPWHILDYGIDDVQLF